MIHTVWKNCGVGVKPNQKCLKRQNGDFINIDDGTIYPCSDHYASKQYKAIIQKPDTENMTGMYHLYEEFSGNNEENKKSWKEKYIGCYVTVEPAHKCGDLKIYRCLELNGEYFSENELQILEDDSSSWINYK